MYRFRSYEALIGRKELQNQEIYFASLKELNDPIEGYKHTYWQGDRIQWESLFVHYAACLAITIISKDVFGDTFTLNRSVILPKLEKIHLLDERAIDLFKEIRNGFSEIAEFKALTTALESSGRKISTSELEVILELAHLDLCVVAMRCLNKLNIIADLDFQTRILRRQDFSSTQKIVDILASLKEKSNVTEAARLMEIAGFANMQMRLRSALGHSKNGRVSDYILSDFPFEYVLKINDLMYPQWYVACFTSNWTNSSLWGNYGDRHKGFCLKFKDEINNKLHIESSKSSESISVTLKPIIYSNERPEINFFEWLGRLPIPQILEHWMTGFNGEVSAKYRIFIDRIDEWRKEYHQVFDTICRTKLEDWLHEKEMRITIDDMFGNYEDPANRVFRYDFEDLEGIAFGLNTKLEHKIEVINIIKAKCRSINRDDFSFYNARYSAESGIVEVQRMSFIDCK